MCDPLLTLFFGMVLLIVSFIFVAKMLTFTLFVFVGFSRCHFLVFFAFLAAQFVYFCVARYFACHAVLRCSVCVVSSFLLLIFWIIS